jgi:hypothetical protein
MSVGIPVVDKFDAYDLFWRWSVRPEIRRSIECLPACSGLDPWARAEVAYGA